MTVISGKPSWRLTQGLWGKDAYPDIFPFNHHQSHFFYSARYALSAGIEVLNLRRGEVVLIPSYNCGVELDPFLHHGVRTECYRVNRDMSVDIADIKERITGSVKAVLVTHFLGFPQPIEELRQLCQRNGIHLIEDCAHALLSAHNGTELGTWGDIAVFSLMKTLPVADGGVLVINIPAGRQEAKCEKPNLFATYAYATQLLRRRTNGIRYSPLGQLEKQAIAVADFSFESARFVLAGLRKALGLKGLSLVKPDSFEYRNELSHWGISELSKRIIASCDLAEIRSTRRRNFQYLLEHFTEKGRYELPIRQLTEGVCPLFFPVILDSVAKRERIYRLLKEHGVTTHPWWDRFHPAVPWKDFPDAVSLKERLFGFPVHQDLSFSHLDHMIHEFEIAYGAELNSLT